MELKEIKRLYDNGNIEYIYYLDKNNKVCGPYKEFIYSKKSISIKSYREGIIYGVSKNIFNNKLCYIYIMKDNQYHGTYFELNYARN